MTHEPQVHLDLEPEIDRIYDEFGALLNEREAADLLGTPVRTLQSWRTAGAGPPYIKLGEAPNAPVRYPAAKLRRFLQRHTIRTAGTGAVLGGMAEATDAGLLVPSPPDDRLPADRAVAESLLDESGHR